MNFFEHQHQARKNTQLLVVLFIIAVVATVIAVNYVATLIYVYRLMELSRVAAPSEVDFFQAFMDVGKFVMPATALAIAIISHLRINSLSGSGRKVAQFLGAVALDLDPQNVKEQQLRNVVEEMSIASGVPMPDIYVMRDEPGINAFAAGTEHNNAAIGVTQGLIDNLNRDEMQGVIAHEFSHIFNGDMKLNVQLLGTLAGLTFIALSGRMMLQVMGRRSRYRSSNSRNGGGAAGIALVGLGLMIIGYVGVFFGRWIKAAVSRQREFLADASAVQFTRNPEGLGGALVKIKGLTSSVQEAKADDASHFFFGSIKRYFLFATHPPIEERLRRLKYIQLPKAPTKPAPLPPQAKPAEGVARVGKPSNEDLFMATVIVQGLSSSVRQKLHEPRSALQVVLALLAKDHPRLDSVQKIDPSIREAVNSVPPHLVLTLIDLALPALRRLESGTSMQLLNAVEAMVREDNNVTPLEIAVLSILRRHLVAGPKARAGGTSLSKSQPLALDLVKAMAVCSGANDGGVAAYQAGARHLGFEASAVQSVWSSKPDPLAVDRGLQQLIHLPPKEKQLLFEALWAVAHHDQKVNTDELMYLRAFSEALEIPLPPSITATA